MYLTFQNSKHRNVMPLQTGSWWQRIIASSIRGGKFWKWKVCRMFMRMSSFTQQTRIACWKSYRRMFGHLWEYLKFQKVLTLMSTCYFCASVCPPLPADCWVSQFRWRCERCSIGWRWSRRTQGGIVGIFHIILVVGCCPGPCHHPSRQAPNLPAVTHSS